MNIFRWNRGREGRSGRIAWFVLQGVALTILVCLPLGFARAAAPQTSTATISGRVSVASTQGVSNNLSAIAVTLTGPAPSTTSQEQVSDAEGRYEFDRL
ncbi:MAG TPA: hypothetical protein VGI34_06380, partial [Candidatus Acidoferrales bacterium]